MNLFELYAKISVDDTGFKKSMENAQKVSKNVANAMKELQSPLDKAKSGFNAIAHPVETAKANIEKLKKATESIRHPIETFKNKVSEASTALETKRNKLSTLSAGYDSAKKKVDELTKEFNKSAKESGTSSQKTQELAKKLNEAEREAAEAKKELDDYSESVSKSGKKSESASNGIGKFASKLGNGLKTAAKIGTAAVGVAAAGITALTKAAVNNYAEYEQLVGGVETLFKTSSDKVMKYAENAYKTAGLSANEYMETVTSFSASLLQSLGGDTEAAAKYADMAITDMSDNANKMGTSMEMIQNAYQGFAKQNYTMLDNLKLGYGGTKEEMQRLLEDAEKLSGIEYDISSYSDIVDAIHVVQTEMGITGTTAKEAGTTIQGSVSSMKSAWTNLLTGLADGNADIEQLVDNLVTTIVGDGTENNLGVFGNILPAIETALGGAAKLIEGVAPKIIKIFPGLVKKVVPSLISSATGMVKAVIAVLPDLMNTVVDALVDNAPALTTAAIGLVQSLIQGIQDNYQILVDGAIQIVTQLATGILDMLPEIVQLGLDVIVSLANGIADSLPELIPTIIDVILQIVDTLTDPKNLRNLLDAALAVIEALAEGLIENIDKLVDATFTIIENLVEFLLDPENIEKLLICALDIVIALGKGLIDAIPKLLGNVGELVGSIVDKIFETDWEQVGIDIVNGIWDGIKELWNEFVTWVSDAFGGVADSIRDLLGIDSADFIHETADGRVKIDAPFDFGGLEDSINESLDASRKSGQSVRALRSIIGAIGDKTGLDDLIPDIGAPFPKFGLDDTSLNIDASVRKFENGLPGMDYVGAYAGNTSINIEINGAQYKDEDALADAISYRLQEMTERRARA